MKKLSFIQRSRGSHWVGDGFPVRTLFSYNDIADKISPFLLMDYAGPAEFPPTSARRGVGEHPHRGFETVTIVYEGEVEHRDSSGGGGRIGPGDVQWMTAGAGVVHEEFHGRDYASRGGPFEMIQLWVNLPKKNKMTPGKYQAIETAQIPKVDLPQSAGSVRVIAGEYQGNKGPSSTFSPINVWDIQIQTGAGAQFETTEGYTTALFVLRGRITLPSGETIKTAEMAVLETQGTQFAFKAEEATQILLLNGLPLNEPIVGYGPFVMNTEEEVRQAFVDYENGRMGTL